MARGVPKIMEPIFRLSICLAAFTVVTAQDHEKLFSSKFEVLSPPNLAGELDHRGALFGINPVGDSILTQVFYTQRSLCGETPGTPDVIKEKGYILLVDRGGCSFVEKVRNAQADNATAVLIADNTCLCSFQESCDADQECEDSEPTMDDDGTGSDIRIPSMMIFKPDADRLRDELKAGTVVDLKLSWPVPKATDGVTQYTIWLTPDDLVSHQFLLSFHEAAIALGDKAVFKPKMFINDGTMKGCRYYESDPDPCQGSCTNFGRYCEPRSYYDFDSYDNKGTKMVVESLRRACIWHVYGEDGIGKEWWTYVQLWIVRCGSSQYSSTCAESLYAESDLDTGIVEQCMLDSGNFRNDGTNILLDSFLDEAADYDVTFAPTLFVNGAVIRGSLTFGTILETICMTYDATDYPEICNQWADCSAQCSSEAACILRTGQCLEYEVPVFTHQDVQYNDDYIDSAVIIETEQPEDNTQQQAQTDPPAAAPTNPPVPAPTDPPVAPPTDPSTDPPVPLPTNPPVPPPTDAPVAPSTYPPVPLPGQIPNQPPGNEDLRVVETIQIFESPNSSSSTFATGLAAGIGGAVLFGIALIVLGARDRRRQDDMRPLIPSPSFVASDLTMDDDYSYPSDHFRDEERSSRRSYGDDPRKHPKKKYRSRRAIRRARAERTLDEGPIPRRQQYSRDEDSVYTRETHSRRDDERYMDEESVLSRHHEDGSSRRSRNPYEEDDTMRQHEDGSRSSHNRFEEDGTLRSHRRQVGDDEELM